MSEQASIEKPAATSVAYAAKAYTEASEALVLAIDDHRRARREETEAGNREREKRTALAEAAKALREATLKAAGHDRDTVEAVSAAWRDKASG
jgi:hypothetical protein